MIVTNNRLSLKVSNRQSLSSGILKDKKYHFKGHIFNDFYLSLSENYNVYNKIYQF